MKRKLKIAAVVLFVIALLLSHIMCFHVGYAYCDRLWEIEYQGYSAPAVTEFFLAIPYLLVIVLAVTVACVIRAKAKRMTTEAGNG